MKLTLKIVLVVTLAGACFFLGRASVEVPYWPTPTAEQEFIDKLFELVGEPPEPEGIEL